MSEQELVDQEPTLSQFENVSQDNPLDLENGGVDYEPKRTAEDRLNELIEFLRQHGIYFKG